MKKGDKVWFDGMNGKVGAVITSIEGDNWVSIKVSKEFLKGTPHEYKGGRVSTKRITPRDKPKPHNFF